MPSQDINTNIEKFINQIETKDLANAKNTLKSLIDIKLTERLEKIEKGDK